MFFKKTVKRPPQPPLRRPLPPPPPKRPFPWVLILVISFCVWFVYESLTPHLPQPSEPPRLYSNQCQQDLRSTLLEAIRQARSSVRVVMFGLNDPAVLSLLSKKIQQEISTTVYYDSSGSPKLRKLLGESQIHPIKNPGLMHQKILVLDDETVFIGSANMTTASLKMHDNLVVGFKSHSAAHFLTRHAPHSPGYFRTMVGGQQIEIWLLPDPRGHALTDLRKKIRSANRSIRIALFTFTHPVLLDEVIEAHKRGVAVTVVVDMHSGLGASAATVEKLKKAKVRVLLSQGVQLLHHKFVYIDEQTLLTGSANWTKAAFYKNSDCILTLHHLTAEQRSFMKHLWRRIETNAKLQI